MIILVSKVLTNFKWILSICFPIFWINQRWVRFRCESPITKWIFINLHNVQFCKQYVYRFYRCTVHFEIYIVHTPNNALFIDLVKSFKFTLKYTIISLLLSVINGHYQGALSVPN